MGKRAVIYARVSTEEQGKQYSIPTQIESCTRYAADHDFTIVREFTDMFTGTEMNRPGLDDLLDFIPGQHIDAIIVHDLDRLSRVPGHIEFIEEEAASCNTVVEYVLGGYDHTAEGDFFKGVKAYMARYENRQRVERCRRGKMGRVKAGQVLCPRNRAPYGYDYVRDGKGKGHFEINAEESSVVLQIFTWLVDEGFSSYQIAKELSGRVLTKGDTNLVVGAAKTRSRPMDWDPQTIRRIVTNSTYKGEWYWGKTHRRKVNGKTVQSRVPREEWVMVPVPVLIDPERWEQAQSQLKKNKRVSSRNTKHKYLLRSLVFCPCGRRWTGRYKNKAGIGYYRCPTIEARPWAVVCPNRYSIRQDQLESTVWQVICDFLLETGNLQEQIEQQKRDSKTEAKRKVGRLRAIERTIADTDRKLGMLLDQVLSGDFPKAIIETHKHQLVTQREELVEEQERLEAELETVTITEDQERAILAFSEQVRLALGDVSFEEKRRVLELLNIRVDVIDHQTVKISGIITDGSIVRTLSG